MYYISITIVQKPVSTKFSIKQDFIKQDYYNV